MNLKTINSCIGQYKVKLSDPEYDGWRLWELVAQFQKSWDLNASDMSQMYKSSFEFNSPLWNQDNYYPKKAMERYINVNEDLVRASFKDLMNEKREISGRIDRFAFQCDELYKMDRKLTEKVEPHFHGDKRMIFIYLSFLYPDSYSLYDFPLFKLFMEKIGSKSSPLEADIERYVKVCKTLSVLIQKDKELIDIVQDNVFQITNDQLFPMLLVFELYGFVGHYKF
tara:strand:- start:281 stop:955 length:675 start_codon:yes stop_codon:yes gene_type:complete